jgi:dTMP kinase
MASRAQLVEQVIAPALAAGEIVVADRFLSASVAYQAYGGGLPTDEVRKIGAFATGGLYPDMTFVLDLDVEDAFDRLGRQLDRIENRSLDYHERVRRGFLELARQDGKRFLVIDASRGVDEIAVSHSRS